MRDKRLDKCHRCGCPEEAHFDAHGKPGPCDQTGCRLYCSAFRDRGEDLSRINRLLVEIANQAVEGARVAEVIPGNGWDGVPVVYEDPPTPAQQAERERFDALASELGVPPRIFRVYPRGELEVTYGTNRGDDAGGDGMPGDRG